MPRTFRRGILRECIRLTDLRKLAFACLAWRRSRLLVIGIQAMTFRAAVAALVLGFIFATLPGIARADDYPSKPIRVIVPYPAGGGVDVVARMFQVRLGEILGQQII